MTVQTLTIWTRPLPTQCPSRIWIYSHSPITMRLTITHQIAWPIPLTSSTSCKTLISTLNINNFSFLLLNSILCGILVICFLILVDLRACLYILPICKQNSRTNLVELLIVMDYDELCQIYYSVSYSLDFIMYISNKIF